MKVAIIGAGYVGAAAAQRIAEADLADVVLLDIIEGKAEAVALDLSSVSSIIRHSRSISGTTDYKQIAGADIVVLTCGRTRKPGEDRKDLLRTNVKIVKDVAQKIAEHCFDSIVVVVTNPLDVMTYLALKITGFSRTQVIGMGGVSDCARFNMLVAAELTITSHHVQSMIIGPHSDNMVILPRLSTVRGIPVTELLPEDRIERIMDETRNFGARLVKLIGKGSAYLGPSAGIFSLVDSIINDRKSILCASAYLTGQYGLQDLCVGVPVKIGRLGIEEIIEVNLDKKEKSAFLSSAKSVKDLTRKLGV